MKNTHSTAPRTFFAHVFLFAVVLFMGWNVHSVFAISAPTGLSAVCGYAGTSVTTYWTPVSGSTAQAIRFDGAYPSWNGGACATMNAGDLCQDLGASVNQSYQTISAGVTYSWWVHAIDAVGWSGASSGSFNCPSSYTLTVTKAGTGSGTVTSDNAINCGATCSKSSISNSTVKLTATPTSGSIFSGWSGCTSIEAGTGNCVVDISSAKTITATFSLSSTNYTLSIGKTGSGNVTSNPIGISCTGTDAAASNAAACTKSYLSGTVVTLTATPNGGETFTGWSGPCTGTGACAVTMDGLKTVTANFSVFPPPPSNLAPSCASDGTSVTYSWTGATGATGYAVRMDVNPVSFDTVPCANSSGGYGANGDYCKDDIGNTTNVTLITGVNVPHNFWVQSRGPSGEWGGSVLRTGIACNSASALVSPTNLSATCAANGTSVQLSWGGVSGATSYALRADKNPVTWNDVWWANSGKCTNAGYFTTALDTTYTGGTGDYCQNGLTSATKNLAITPGTNYLWWVHAIDSANAWSTPSQNVSVNCPDTTTAAPATPANFTSNPGCVANAPKVDLSWKSSSGATSYDVQWCTGIGCTPSTVIPGITNTSYAHTGRTANAVYGYRVLAKNINGSSSYSATSYTTASDCTAGTPRLIICPATAPSITVGGSTNLEARYWANLALIPDCTTGSYNTVTGSATWSSSNNGLATVSSGGVVTGVAAGTPTITANYSGLSAVKSVTVTAPSTPPAPTGLTATPDAACGSGKINVSWNSVSGASGYDLQIDGGAWLSLGNVLTYTHTGLANGSSHTYKVRAWNIVGPGNPSSSVTQTAPAVCAAPSCTGLPPSNATACSLTDPGVTIPYGIVPACLMTATKCHYICNQGYIEVGASCVPTQCNDGVDNDADTLVDLATDPGCANINDNDESNLAPDLTVDKRLVEQGGGVVLTYHPNGQTCTLTGGTLNLTGLSANGSSLPQTINGRTTYTLSCPVGSDSVTVEVVPIGYET